MVSQFSLSESSELRYDDRVSGSAVSKSVEVDVFPWYPTELQTSLKPCLDRRGPNLSQVFHWWAADRYIKHRLSSSCNFHIVGQLIYSKSPRDVSKHIILSQSFYSSCLKSPLLFSVIYGAGILEFDILFLILLFPCRVTFGDPWTGFWSPMWHCLLKGLYK